MIRIDIEQGSEEWFKCKWGRIGGTDSDQLFNKNKNTILYKLISEQTENFELTDSYISEDMQRGKDLEPYALNELELYSGVDFDRTGWLQCEEFDILGISPDAITPDLTIAAEIKCPGRKRHTETLIKDAIPSDNIHQCVHYFTINPKLQKLFFVSYRPESHIRPLFVKVLTRQSKIDLGWTIKGTIKEDRGKGLKEYVETLPDIRTVDEWVKVAKGGAKEIQEQINSIINKLKF